MMQSKLLAPTIRYSCYDYVLIYAQKYFVYCGF